MDFILFRFCFFVFTNGESVIWASLLSVNEAFVFFLPWVFNVLLVHFGECLFWLCVCNWQRWCSSVSSNWLKVDMGDLCLLLVNMDLVVLELGVGWRIIASDKLLSSSEELFGVTSFIAMKEDVEGVHEICCFFFTPRLLTLLNWSFRLWHGSSLILVLSPRISISELLVLSPLSTGFLGFGLVFLDLFTFTEAFFLQDKRKLNK